MESDPKTPGWLLAVSACAVLLAIAIAWAAMPWQLAVVATCCAFLGAEFGMVGARWHDDNN